MVAIGPITYANSYSCSNTGNRKRTEIGIKSDDIIKCVYHDHMIYEEVVEKLGFITRDKYNEIVKKAGLPSDSCRKRAREEARAMELIKSGKDSPQQLAEAMNISLSKSRRLFDRLNISTSRSNMLDRHAAEIQAKYNMGWPFKKVVEFYKTSADTLRDVNYRNNLQTFEEQQREYILDLKRSKMQYLIDTFKTPEGIEKGTNGLLIAKKAIKYAKFFGLSFQKLHV